MTHVMTERIRKLIRSGKTKQAQSEAAAMIARQAIEERKAAFFRRVTAWRFSGARDSELDRLAGLATTREEY